MSYGSPTPSARLEATAAEGDIAAAIKAGTALGRPQKNPDPDGAHFVVVPEGWQPEPLPTLGGPARASATVRLRDAVSFVRYFNDHKVPRSRIFATLEPALFLAVFDEFGTAEESEVVLDQADWRGFRAEFKVPASREWLLWTNANRKHMSQLAFAEFLQDNLPDITQPSGSDLLELALNFEATSNGSFVSAQRLQNGDHNVTLRSETSGGSTIRMPEHIELAIPVFENEPPRPLRARLRYRAKDQLALWYELDRPHKVLEAAFRETWTRIEQEGQTQILLGTPE